MVLGGTCRFAVWPSRMSNRRTPKRLADAQTPQKGTCKNDRNHHCAVHRWFAALGRQLRPSVRIYVWLFTELCAPSFSIIWGL